jgi:hypothetical protein
MIRLIKEDLFENYDPELRKMLGILTYFLAT